MGGPRRLIVPAHAAATRRSSRPWTTLDLYDPSFRDVARAPGSPDPDALAILRDLARTEPQMAPPLLIWPVAVNPRIADQAFYARLPGFNTVLVVRQANVYRLEDITSKALPGLD